MQPASTTDGSLLAKAMSDSFQWALGYPVNDLHFLFVFLATIVGGAKMLQMSGATMNARRYSWLAVGPCWALGLFAIFVGMAVSLTGQAEGSDWPRWATAGLGGGIALLAVAAVASTFLMSMNYWTAVSAWVTVGGCWAVVVGISSIVGAGLVQGKAKVLHWQGEVQSREQGNFPWKPMADDRKVVPQGGEVSTGNGSGAVVFARGNHILVMPNSTVRFRDLGDNPVVELVQGRIYSKATMSAARNMRYRTGAGWFQISGDDLLLVASPRGDTTLVVAHGGVYASKDDRGESKTVGKGQMVVVTPANGVGTPVSLSADYLDQLKQLEGYFSNPFAAHTRRMISGEAAPKPPEPAPVAPQAPEPDAKKE